MNEKLRVALVGLILLLAAGTALAQGAPPATETAPAPAKHFLWKATLDGHTLYLLGSIHLAPESLYPLSPVIENAFSASTSLAVEADIDAMDTAKLQQQVMEIGLYPAEQSLKASVSPELYTKLESALPALGIPMAAADRMRPWLLALTVTSLRMQKMGYKPENGIDLHFLKLARGQKEILELESADFQLKLLSGFSDELQRLFLEQTLEDPLSSQEMVEKMVRYWRTGDAAGMEDLLFTELREKPELAPIFRQMFDDRNGPMADKIEGYLKAGKDCLVIVGAGHLVGGNGILRLLEARGIHAEQQ